MNAAARTHPAIAVVAADCAPSDCPIIPIHEKPASAAPQSPVASPAYTIAPTQPMASRIS